MRSFTVILSVVALCGCCGEKISSQKTSINLLRPDDSRFSPRQHEAVSAARGYLEKRFREPIDGLYRVSDTHDGYAVEVYFVVAYEDGRPQTSPGAWGTVILNQDLSFADYKEGY